MGFQREFVLTREGKQILWQSARLAFVEIKSQIFYFIKRIFIDLLQQTKELNLGGTSLPLAKLSNRESSLKNLNKMGSSMVLSTTKLVFDLFICQSFKSMFIPLFKFTIPIAFDNRKPERSIFLQVYISLLY
jgi:hypothetical protein